ncbi:hypothetical protein DER46DRAFT_191972 [Fusarium sp. MPI-SDFR-AT-0072]|nr:hypothetical protein DER46DRAFT_191972 [Fusarium sp. MPI-SDFR-AT-0072]
MSQPCQMNAPEGSFVRKPASGPPRSEEANAPSMRPGIDLERQAGSWGGERGWDRMCRQIQQDKRHMVAPRLTHIVWRCITLRANRMVTLYAEAEKAPGLGEEVTNLDEKLEDECLKYLQLILQASQVSALDKPGNYFLRHLLPCFKEMLNSRGGDGIYLDEPMNDWVSLNQPNRMDQLICLAPHTKVGRALFRPFVTGKEEIGNNVQYHYNEGIIRSIAFTLFTSIIAVFACAPAAIQSLNVRSAVGEVVVYLVFVIAFGWLSQGLILGFEKVLLTCLAYAGLMANLLRGG